MKKTIEWKTPKEYQRKVKKIIMEIAEDTAPGFQIEQGDNELLLTVPKLKKKPPKSKVCRKLKAPHQFGEWEPYFYGFEKDRSNPSKFIRHCKACNRQELKFTKLL